MAARAAGNGLTATVAVDAELREVIRGTGELTEWPSANRSTLSSAPHRFPRVPNLGGQDAFVGEDFQPQPRPEARNTFDALYRPVPNPGLQTDPTP
jgi:hypothetical protein